MTIPTLDDFFFAWDRADHPEGPWRHLRVLSLSGHEALSQLYSFALELVHDGAGADVDVDDLVGAAAALKIRTLTTPAWRIVHGVVASAQQLSDAREGARYRVLLRPPFLRAVMMNKSMIQLERTIQQAIDRTLQRKSLGAGLALADAGKTLATGESLDSYVTPRLSYLWRLVDDARVTDPKARPYNVQYDESDWNFVSRLLEEEGIAYHFEHGDDECRLVLCDYDGGRVQHDDAPLSPEIPGREVSEWVAGARLRPRSAHLDDYAWQTPDLDLRAPSPAGVTPFTDVVHPGRYQHSADSGRVLAAVREQRFDSERSHASAKGHCRVLGAGSVVSLEHPNAKFSGRYLVSEIRHRAEQPGSFAREAGERYSQEYECLRCGSGRAAGESKFRPARLARKPRIYGSQTAVVTADPSKPDAEINVGGAANIGCVRLRFFWDMTAEARAADDREPSSCWVRVSQFFAGSSHGAMWHPRVGDEVIVEHLDGDPDRPIVTGRVYNAKNLAPADATARPTYSAIKSLSSPRNGNYNLIAFEDEQGKEEIIVHAARDFISNIERNHGVNVGLDYDIDVKGHIEETAGKHVTLTANGGNFDIVSSSADVDVVAAVNINESAGANYNLGVGANMNASVSANLSTSVGANLSTTVGAAANLHAGALIAENAPVIVVTGGAMISQAAPLISASASGAIVISAPSVSVSGAAIKIAGAGSVAIDGGNITVSGGEVKVAGAHVSVGAGTVDVGGGTVNVKGGAINLNC